VTLICNNKKYKQNIFKLALIKAVLALGTGLVFSEKKIPKEYNELKDKNKNIGSACTTTCDNYRSPSTGQIV
jgi:hypothetical protein